MSFSDLYQQKKVHVTPKYMEMLEVAKQTYEEYCQFVRKYIYEVIENAYDTKVVLQDKIPNFIQNELREAGFTVEINNPNGYVTTKISWFDHENHLSEAGLNNIEFMHHYDNQIYKYEKCVNDIMNALNIQVIEDIYKDNTAKQYADKCSEFQKEFSS